MNAVAEKECKEISVKNILEIRLSQFEDAIQMTEKLKSGKTLLEIDGCCDETGTKEGLYGIKVLNNSTESAWIIPVDAFTKYSIKEIVQGLIESVLETRLHSVTRIVG